MVFGSRDRVRSGFKFHHYYLMYKFGNVIEFLYKISILHDFVMKIELTKVIK